MSIGASGHSPRPAHLGPEGVVNKVLSQHAAQRLHHRLMILPLRQAGNRDAAYHAGASDPQRESAAMRRVIRNRQTASRIKCRFLQPHLQTNAVTGLVEVFDNIEFSTHPVDVLRRRSGRCGIKKRSREISNINSEAPRVVFRKPA